MEFIGYVSIFCTGVVLGLLGSGGSILAIPVFVYMFSIQIVEATSYSLILVGMTSLVGAYQRIYNSLVDLRSAFLFGIPSIIAIIITRKWLIKSIPDILFSFHSMMITKRLIILITISTFIFVSSYLMITDNFKPIIKTGDTKIILLIFLGSLIGIVTGVAGIGGGFLIVPVLIIMARLPFKVAAGTSLFIIAMKSAAAFFVDISNFHLNWSFLVVIAGIGIAGILIGNLLSKRISGIQLKKSFGWIMLVIAMIILVKETVLSIYK